MLAQFPLQCPTGKSSLTAELSLLSISSIPVFAPQLLFACLFYIQLSPSITQSRAGEFPSQKHKQKGIVGSLKLFASPLLPLSLKYPAIIKYPLLGREQSFAPALCWEPRHCLCSSLSRLIPSRILSYLCPAEVHVLNSLQYFL